MMAEKIAFVFGTRPEIIKLSSTIRLCLEKGIPFFTVHTGQHYSHNMSKLFLEELDLPEPDYRMDIKSRAPHMQGDHTGKMLIGLEEILLKEMPSVVLVQGDTNTALAGALTASKISTTRSFTGFNMKVGHVEAGLRSYDRSMPEEINRVMADHLSDLLFAPTERSRDTIISEGIKEEKVKVTGNTVVDALYYALDPARNGEEVLKRYGIEKDSYILLTLHRQENVDNRERVIEVLKGISEVCRRHALPAVFPIHPRTVKNFGEFGIKLSIFIRTVEPCGFRDFLELEKGARLVLTDSGGVQEEACVLKVPCVTLRDSTERPETVEVGANVIAGVKAPDIARAAEKMLESKRDWRNPFGEGDSASKIIETIEGGLGS